MGLADLPEDQVRAYVEAGRLVRVPADWWPPFRGYHRYYPSRRQRTSAYALLVEALRYGTWGPTVPLAANRDPAYRTSSASSARPRTCCQVSPEGVTRSKWPASETSTSLGAVATLPHSARA